jgi:hypothetical protein
MAITHCRWLARDLNRHGTAETFAGISVIAAQENLHISWNLTKLALCQYSTDACGYLAIPSSNQCDLCEERIAKRYALALEPQMNGRFSFGFASPCNGWTMESSRGARHDNGNEVPQDKVQSSARYAHR